MEAIISLFFQWINLNSKSCQSTLLPHHIQPLSDSLINTGSERLISKRMNTYFIILYLELIIRRNFKLLSAKEKDESHLQMMLSLN